VLLAHNAKKRKETDFAFGSRKKKGKCRRCSRVVRPLVGPEKKRGGILLRQGKNRRGGNLRSGRRTHAQRSVDALGRVEETAAGGKKKRRETAP